MKEFEYLDTIMSEELNQRLLKDRVPISGGIELTPKCNFKCIHCYETNERDLCDESIPLDILLQKIDEMVDMGMLSVYFTGGEAMLYEHFEYIYKYTRSKGVLVGVLSNGSSITKSKIELFKQYNPTMIDISIYGASNETYEKVTGKKEMFDLVMKNLELLKENDIPFNIKTVIMRENFCDLNKMKEIADYFNVPFKFFTNIRPYNDGNKSPMNHMLSNEKIMEIELNTPELCMFYSNQKKRQLSEKQKNKNCFLCKAGRNGFFLNYNGMLNACVRSRDSEFNVVNSSFKEGWSYLNDKYVLPKKEKSFKCAECDILDFCEYCPGQFKLETGDETLPPNDICELAHLRYEHYIRKEE